jgi:hypothetical protein
LLIEPPGLQALTGIAMQRTENQALLLWDHGVLMREKMIYWDGTQSCSLPQFVREQVVRLHRVAGQSLFSEADGVLPCNATFNPKWEVTAHCALCFDLENSIVAFNYFICALCFACHIVTCSSVFK